MDCPKLADGWFSIALRRRLDLTPSFAFCLTAAVGKWARSLNNLPNQSVLFVTKKNIFLSRMSPKPLLHFAWRPQLVSELALWTIYPISQFFLSQKKTFFVADVVKTSFAFCLIAAVGKWAPSLNYWQFSWSSSASWNFENLQPHRYSKYFVFVILQGYVRGDEQLLVKGWHLEVWRYLCSLSSTIEAMHCQ